MKKCLINNNSLRFARIVYGLLLLIAFLFYNVWLVLITIILMAAGGISIKYNILYQFYYRFLKFLFKDISVSVEKELNETRFACALAGFFLISALILFYLGKYEEVGWALVLIVSFLMLLVGLTGFCVAALIYAGFKKIIRKK